MKYSALLCSFAAAAILAASQAKAQSTLSDRSPETQSAKLTADEKISAFEKRLKDQPDDRRSQAGLASAFIQKMRETMDFAYLNRATVLAADILAADPTNYDGLRLNAEIDTHRHDFPGAAVIAAKLLERNPSDSGALGMLGDSQMELGQYTEAGDAYRRMLALAPHLASYNRVAYHQFVTGHPKEAINWMATAVEAGSPISENLAWCLVEFGDMLFKVGRVADARIAYDRALAIMPGYHRANAALGRMFASTGKFEQAAASLEKAQAVIPLPEYAGALDAIYREIGRTAEANKQKTLIDVIDQLGRANGEKGNRALAVVYADQGRNLDRALELIRGELATRKDVYTYDALSWVLFRSGHQKESEEASRMALELHTPEPMFLYHAGVIASAGGDEVAGKEFLRQALALNSDFAFPQALDAKERLGLDQAGAMRNTNVDLVLR